MNWPHTSAISDSDQISSFIKNQANLTKARIQALMERDRSQNKTKANK